MCPACLATAAVMVGSAISGGGIGAALVRFRRGGGLARRSESGMQNKGEKMVASTTSKLSSAKVVSSEQWLAARKELLKKEKEFTRLRDEVSRQRRELPWEKVEKQYVFDGPGGKERLTDLFGGRSQLMVYHFMFGPGWEQGCPSCSFLADHFDGALVHLAARDVRLVVVSRAPIAEIEAFKKRMGWRFHWVSSFGTDFNYDFHVSFTTDELNKGEMIYNYQVQKFPSEEGPGASAFYKDPAGNIFHTYSTYGRGLDILLGAYNWLDMAPKGRDEEGLAHTMAWVRHHDRYDESYQVDAKQTYVQPAKAAGGCCAKEGQS
jgi:predicted dithiol-disulfide oxidoreductase (DUF899 family)